MFTCSCGKTHPCPDQPGGFGNVVIQPIPIQPFAGVAAAAAPVAQVFYVEANAAVAQAAGAPFVVDLGRCF